MGALAPLRFAVAALHGRISILRRRFRLILILLRLAPLYLVLGLLKHVVPVHRLVRWMWRPPAGSRNPDSEACKLSALIKLSQIAGLTDRDCVQRSLVLYRILSRSGADPILVVGFRRTDAKILGHAWVIVAGRPVIQPEGEALGFSPAFAFGRQGQFLPNA